MQKFTLLAFIFSMLALIGGAIFSIWYFTQPTDVSLSSPSYQLSFTASEDDSYSSTIYSGQIMSSSNQMELFVQYGPHIELGNVTRVWASSTKGTVIHQYENGILQQEGCIDVPVPSSTLSTNRMSTFPLLLSDQVTQNIGADRYNRLVSSFGSSLEFRSIGFEEDIFILVFEQNTKRPLAVLGHVFTANITQFQPYVSAFTISRPLVPCNATTSRNVSSSLTLMKTLSNQNTNTCFWNCNDKSNRIQGKIRSRCVFLHGLAGYDGTDISYWGGENGGLMKFAHANCDHVDPVFFNYDPNHPTLPNTATMSPSDSRLQDAYYEAALKGQSNGVVFCHSMCNVILARACIDQNKCVKFFSVNGPLFGSSAPDRLYEWCPVRDGGLGTSGPLMSSLANVRGNCVPSTYTLKTCGNKYGTNVLCQSLEIMRAYVKGAMCGTSSWGLFTWMSPGLYAIDQLATRTTPGSKDWIKNPSVNDGMVPYDSCKVMFFGVPSSSSSNPWYITSTNHGDGTGRNGDSWWYADSKPLSWFKNMILKGM